jgi:hypothetical protein
LRNGDAGNLTPIQTIFDTPYQMSFTKYDWMIPSNLTTDTSYVLVASNSAGVSYSAYFTIVGLPPGVTASDIATSTAPATIATAAASSASSASASSSASAVSQSAAVSTAAVSTAAASSAAASSSAASSVAAASSTPSTSITLKQAVATSGSNHLKAGVMGIAGAAAVAALLA